MSYRKKHVKSKIHQIRPKKRFYKKPFFWIFISLLILIFGGIYLFLFFSDVWVKNIIVLRNSKVPSASIEKIAEAAVNKKIISFGGWGVYSKSIFLADTQNVSQQILEKFPQIEKVSITKKYPETIVLGITEREPAALFCPSEANSSCFLVDANGVAFEKSSQAYASLCAIRQTTAPNNVSLGEKIIDEKSIDAVLKIGKNLKDNFQVGVLSALIADSSRLNIKTSEGWDAYFDLGSDMAPQIIKLDSLLKNDIMQGSRANLQYIDLRFKDRAYYK